MRCHSRFTLHGIAGASKETNTARTGGAAGGPPLCIAMYLIGKKGRSAQVREKCPSIIHAHHVPTELLQLHLARKRNGAKTASRKGKGRPRKPDEKERAAAQRVCVCGPGSCTVVSLPTSAAFLQRSGTRAALPLTEREKEGKARPG